MVDIEQQKFDEIRGRVFELSLRLQAKGRADAEEYLAFAKEHLVTLAQADSDLETWRINVERLVERVQVAGDVTVPERDDPYFRIVTRAVPLILELRKQKEDLEAWLASQVN